MLDKPVGRAADEAIVERSVPHETDDEEIVAVFLDELDDARHRVPWNDMRVERDAIAPRKSLGRGDNLVEYALGVRLASSMLTGKRGSSSTQIIVTPIPRRLASSSAHFSAFSPSGEPSLATSILLSIQPSLAVAAASTAGLSIGAKAGWNHRCAISVGTTALPITAVTSTVYWRWSMM
jgi:hypothetical protein